MDGHIEQKNPEVNANVMWKKYQPFLSLFLFTTKKKIEEENESSCHQRGRLGVEQSKSNHSSTTKKTTRSIISFRDQKRECSSQTQEKRESFSGSENDFRATEVSMSMAERNRQDPKVALDKIPLLITRIFNHLVAKGPRYGDELYKKKG